MTRSRGKSEMAAMKLNGQLTFNGQCEEAFKFYEKLLGGKIVSLLRWGDTPMGEKAPKEFKNKVIHAHMTAPGLELGGGDAPPNMYAKPQGMKIGIEIEQPAEAEKLFKALSEGGSVEMPLQETFWAQRFGMCVDRFGTPWLINCGKH